MSCEKTFLTFDRQQQKGWCLRLILSSNVSKLYLQYLQSEKIGVYDIQWLQLLRLHDEYRL